MNQRGSVPAPHRPNVLWFGDAPTIAVEAEFANRGLRLARRDTYVQTDELVGARGAVFAFSNTNIDSVGALLTSQFTALADHGLLICVAAAGVNMDHLQGEASRFLRGLPADRVFRRTDPEDHELAERQARHDPGLRFRLGFQPDLRGNVEPLSEEDQLLLGRGFSAWGNPILEELTGGLSGARVFSAFTTMDNSTGSWAQPLIAKLGRRDKIEREAENYRLVAPFIPFGLRPNLINSVIGAKRGLLISNLVDKSEPLWDVARRGHADQAIFNLFNTTLGVWRSQGQRQSPMSGSVFAALVSAGIVKPDRIKPEIVLAARSLFGTSQQLNVAALSGLGQQYWFGNLHGDLHAENVRVRGTDAILIDLGACTKGPLVGDLALLETWFAIERHRSEPGGEFANEPWREMVQKLYAPEAFRSPPSPAEVCAPFAWCWDVVRQIRTIALGAQSCPSEYQTAVVAALLRRCCFKPAELADKFRRAVAYAMACELADDMLAEGCARDAA